MKTIKVMVVDDSSFMRKVVSDLLNSDPEIEVIATARDGLDAWDKLRNLDPDVILLDVEMPRWMVWHCSRKFLRSVLGG